MTEEGSNYTIIVLSWNSVSIGGGERRIAGYFVNGVSADNASFVNQTVVTNSIVIDTQMMKLIPNSKYIFKVAAFATEGEMILGEFSDDLEVITCECLCD